MICYETTDGIELQIGALPRSAIDSFLSDNPPPMPSLVNVEAWGGITERIPDYANQEYVEKLQKYNILTEWAQIDLIAPVIVMGVIDTGNSELGDVVGAGAPNTYLRNFVLGNHADLTAVVDLVFYQSTVTQRAIDEAAATFAVYWQGKPVLAWQVPPTDGMRAQLYEDWQVCRYFGLQWGQFESQPGQMQSKMVAFYRIEKRLEWLQTKQAQQKTK